MSTIARAQPTSSAAGDPEPDPFIVLDASSFWINGTTTVNSFTCRVEQVQGRGRLPRVPTSAGPVSLDETPSLAVPVHRFDCGNDRMSRDLQETLEASRHPMIHFQLRTVERITRPVDNPNNWYELRVLGTLQIAGTERLVRISAWGRPVATDVYRVSGCKELKMTYFGIEPPTKFMNLVKVQNDIEVHFDLLVETRQKTSSALASHSLSNPPQCHDE